MKTHNRIIYALYGLILLSTLLILSGNIRSDRIRRTEPQLETVHLHGSYSVNGSGEQVLTQETQFGVSDYNTVVIRGHFTKEIPKNKQLLLRLSNVSVALKVNGSMLYTNRLKEGSIPRSAGNTWAAVTSPGISAEDNVEFVISNIYKNGNPKTFSQTLDSMYIGYESDLGRLLLKKNVSSVLFGFLAIPIGILMFFSGIVIRRMNRRRVLYLALFSISMGLWILLDPNYISFFVDSPLTLSAAEQIFQFLQLISITGFVYTMTGKRMGAVVWSIHWLTVLLFAAATFCRFLKLADYYDFTGTFVVLTCIVCITMMLVLAVEAVSGNRYARKTLLSIFPLGIASLTEQLIYSLGYYYSGYFTQVGFILFLVIQAVYTVQEIKAVFYRLEQAQQMETELVQSRISTMLSQIQPHFLYNALEAIGDLCILSPARAEQAITGFSRFLRGNMNALRNDELIPFEQELEHTRYYLELERLRFGERLRTVFCLGTMEFKLPCLTLQPVVENAVRHGISKRREGGTIMIAASETEAGYLVKVIDDGVGFDTDSEGEDGGTHIGLANVKARLRAQCRGSLTIESIPGEGTTVKIMIPKEGRHL